VEGPLPETVPLPQLPGASCVSVRRGGPGCWPPLVVSFGFHCDQEIFPVENPVPGEVAVPVAWPGLPDSAAVVWTAACRGLVPHLRMIGSGTMALDIYRDGKPLLTAEYPRLFANAAYLARHPDALPDSMGPSEIEPTPDLDVVPIAPVR